MAYYFFLLNRLDVDKYVKSRVGEVVDEGGHLTKRMVIGQIIAPCRKGSWRVSFPGIGLTTNLSSRKLTLLSSADVNKYIASATSATSVESVASVASAAPSIASIASAAPTAAVAA